MILPERKTSLILLLLDNCGLPCQWSSIIPFIDVLYKIKMHLLILENPILGFLELILARHSSNRLNWKLEQQKQSKNCFYVKY